MLKAPALLAVLVLAGCGFASTPAELKADGNPTQHYDSGKAPMVVAACVIPLLDERFGVFGPAQMRPTPDGVEVLTVTTQGFSGPYVLFLVTIDAVDGGSFISGVTMKTSRDDGNDFGMNDSVDAIMQQCAWPFRGWSV
jgi:hypothetical protein